MPPPSPPHSSADVWHVYTDGSAKHERRQAFCGWAARATQIQTRQLRQASGAFPGGDSLAAERQAIVEGLALVPPGGVAWLYSDLDPAVILALLESEAGEAARAHLALVQVFAVVRNSDPHQREMHRAARDAREEARAGTNEHPRAHATRLANAAEQARATARTADVNAPQLRAVAVRLPGFAGPLKARVLKAAFEDVTTQEQRERGRSRVLASLTLQLSGVRSAGRDEQDAARGALRQILAPLAQRGEVQLSVPAQLRDAARDLASVQLLEEERGEE